MKINLIFLLLVCIITGLIIFNLQYFKSENINLNFSSKSEKFIGYTINADNFKYKYAAKTDQIFIFNNQNNFITLNNKDNIQIFFNKWLKSNIENDLIELVKPNGCNFIKLYLSPSGDKFKDSIKDLNCLNKI